MIEGGQPTAEGNAIFYCVMITTVLMTARTFDGILDVEHVCRMSPVVVGSQGDPPTHTQKQFGTQKRWTQRKPREALANIDEDCQNKMSVC
jgi:hypothetical protein